VTAEAPPPMQARQPEFTPAPGAAPLAAMVLAHARMETRLLMRNGEQVLLTLVIPLLLLAVGAASGDVLDLGSGRRIDVLTPGVLALAIISTSFTSLAIATGFERENGVLKRLGGTPLPRSGMLLGKVASLLAVTAVQVGVICVAGQLLGWDPRGGVLGALGVAALVAVGTWAFAALGLLMAGAFRAEATLAAANLLYVVLLVGGAVVVPLSSYPESIQGIVTVLPSGALAEGLRDALSGSGVGLAHVLVLVAWAVVGSALTVRTFRWE